MHAPEKLGNVKGLLAKHQGKEAELLQSVRAKYAAATGEQRP